MLNELLINMYGYPYVGYVHVIIITVTVVFCGIVTSHVLASKRK